MITVALARFFTQIRSYVKHFFDLNSRQNLSNALIAMLVLLPIQEMSSDLKRDLKITRKRKMSRSPEDVERFLICNGDIFIQGKIEYIELPANSCFK